MYKRHHNSITFGSTAERAHRYYYNLSQFVSPECRARHVHPSLGWFASNWLVVVFLLFFFGSSTPSSASGCCKCKSICSMMCFGKGLMWNSQLYLTGCMTEKELPFLAVMSPVTIAYLVYNLFLATVLVVFATILIPR